MAGPVSTALFVFCLVAMLAPTEGWYNLTEVLHKSILFYEAQRSGKLPASNRIPWRGDSALGDISNKGEDLTGGWYDAGDFVKFGFPMSSAVTLLSWGLLEFKQGYVNADEYQNMLDSIKWPLDYFLKCHVKNKKFYGQVGNGDIDHQYWGRAEDMTMSRPIYRINKNNPGSDLAGETAAAMAAGYLVFKDINSTYADILLARAKKLYSFANQSTKGKYSDTITDANTFYQSYGYEDELGWAALWMYKATGTAHYLTDAENLYNPHFNYRPWAFSWDDKRVGAQLLLYQSTGNSIYIGHVKSYVQYWYEGGGMTYTPQKLAWRNDWGSLHYSANTAFLALLAAKDDLLKTDSVAFARQQIGYMLGDTGRSFVVGFGVNPPKRPHHSGASCADLPASCGWSDFSKDEDNPQVLYGALVGGPDQNDNYADERNDYARNEVSISYNAGFQGAVAALNSGLF